MKLALRSLLFALCATGAVTTAFAEKPFVILETVILAVEVPSEKVTLPVNVPGELLMPSACGTLDCPVQGYSVTANTQFLLGSKHVSAAEFRTALLGKSRGMGVRYRVKTGEVLSVESAP
jgi:hypothetical protein